MDDKKKISFHPYERPVKKNTNKIREQDTNDTNKTNQGPGENSSTEKIEGNNPYPKENSSQQKTEGNNSDPSENSSGQKTGGGKRKKKPEKHRQQNCPIPGCNIQNRNIRAHLVSAHFPRIYDFKHPIQQPNIHQKRWDGLKKLTEWILGKESTVENLCDLICVKNLMPESSVISPDLEYAMNTMCRCLQLKKPSQFDPVSPNHPAVLMHWRAMAFLVSFLTNDQRKQFAYLYKEDVLLSSTSSQSQTFKEQPWKSTNHQTQTYKSDSLKSVNNQNQTVKKESWMSTKKQELWNSSQASPYNPLPSTMTHRMSSLRESLSSTMSQRMSSLTSRLCVMDSHFRFDKMCTQLNLDPTSTTPQELLYSFDQVKPKVPVEVLGGLMVYSDTATFPSAKKRYIPDWRIAIGVLPQEALNLHEPGFEDLRVLLSSHRAALGDIGLDRRIPASQWIEQDLQFMRLLSLKKPLQPIILYLRGPFKDPYGSDVHSRCREIMRKQCGPEQPIHINCFSGNRLTVGDWLKYFPFCYFGFSGNVTTFDEIQEEGLQAVPCDRLLLESNAPHLPTRSEIEINYPAYLGEVAVAMACIRKEPLHYICEVTVENTKRLYQL